MNGVVLGKECAVVTVKGFNDKTEEGKIPVGFGSKFSCQWTEASTEDRRVHKESKGEQSEEKRKEGGGGGGEPPNEETIEQKLLKIASELLQTERAYVARLHLLDQVSGVILFVAQ